MNFKIIFTILATALGLAGFFPYLKDVISRKTKPHTYTWLIWVITQATATFAVWRGGGGWSALYLTLTLLSAVIIFFLSLKYGTNNITTADSIILIAALLAIVFWWQLDQPVVSVAMVSVIDLAGYIPSFRKTYHEPWSETLISWALFFISNFLALLALNQYNLLTMLYLSVIGFTNVSLFLFCLFRRKMVQKPY